MWRLARALRLGVTQEVSDVAFVSALCHALRMSIKHTKSEKAQRKADELEKRLDDRPDENQKKEVEREEPSGPDIDSVRHCAQT